MRDFIDEIKQLNYQLTDVLCNKHILAREYYENKFPDYKKDNIIINIISKQIYLITHICVEYRYDFRQRHLKGYDYDNQIEKEFELIIFVNEIGFGGLKKRGTRLWTVEYNKFLCSSNNFQDKEKSLKKEKLLKIFNQTQK
jgi:hypothetical protein